MDEVTETFADSGYSRLPVYHETIDNIIGHPDVMARDIIAFIKKLTLGEVSGTAHCNPLTR